jgi:hypothetical protein
MISSLMVELGNHTEIKIEENMVRHMILNNIRYLKQKFGYEYGEVIIACDNNNYWRKQQFPYYKANRRKLQDQSEIDWKSVFEFFNKIKGELKEYFPYKVIEVETAEADDIIGTIIHEVCGACREINKDILILSADKDYIQLHVYPNIKQYDTVRKRWITHENPKKFLIEHIIKGDSSDGIPNVLSCDDCFVTNTRQKSITKAIIENYIRYNLYPPDDVNVVNVLRNRNLIDFTQIPEHIQAKIRSQYYVKENRDRKKLLSYFMVHKLKNLIERLAEF